MWLKLKRGKTSETNSFEIENTDKKDFFKFSFEKKKMFTANLETQKKYDISCTNVPPILYEHFFIRITER